MINAKYFCKHYKYGQNTSFQIQYLDFIHDLLNNSSSGIFAKTYFQSENLWVEDGWNYVSRKMNNNTYRVAAPLAGTSFSLDLADSQIGDSALLFRLEIESGVILMKAFFCSGTAPKNYYDCESALDSSYVEASQNYSKLLQPKKQYKDNAGNYKHFVVSLINPSLAGATSYKLSLTSLPPPMPRIGYIDSEKKLKGGGGGQFTYVTLPVSASESKAAEGATIRSYQWSSDSGVGFDSATSSTTEARFYSDGEHHIVLTITDNYGMSADIASTVNIDAGTVKEPIAYICTQEGSTIEFSNGQKLGPYSSCVCSDLSCSPSRCYDLMLFNADWTGEYPCHYLDWNMVLPGTSDVCKGMKSVWNANYPLSF